MATRPSHCLVTGASSGIGSALAVRLAAEGWQVSALARRTQRLEVLARDHPGIFAVTGDVTDSHGLASSLAAAQQARGPFRLAVLNAGIYHPHQGLEIDLADFRQQMDINYFGVLACLASLLPAMQAAGDGQIAIMGSVAGYRGLPRSAAYGPTKAALINLAESLRFETAGTGIKLQLINPGFVESEATAINDFEMPDLVSADVAAGLIMAGLASDDFEIAFPKSFVRKMKLLRILPDRLYFALTRRATGR